LGTQNKGGVKWEGEKVCFKATNYSRTINPSSEKIDAEEQRT